VFFSEHSVDVIGRREKERFKRDLKVARLSDEQICTGREFQLLGKDTQKARDAKEDQSTGRNSKKLTISQTWPIDLLNHLNSTALLCERALLCHYR